MRIPSRLPAGATMSPGVTTPRVTYQAMKIQKLVCSRQCIVVINEANVSSRSEGATSKAIWIKLATIKGSRPLAMGSVDYIYDRSIPYPGTTLFILTRFFILKRGIHIYVSGLVFVDLARHRCRIYLSYTLDGFESWFRIPSEAQKY